MDTRQYRLPVTVFQVQTFVTNCCTAIIKHYSSKYESEPHCFRSIATKQAVYGFQTTLSGITSENMVPIRMQHLISQNVNAYSDHTRYLSKPCLKGH
jgi:hypothetical protein